MNKLKIIVESVFSLGHTSVIAGTVESGQIYIGDKVQIKSPSSFVVSKVKGVEVDRKIIPSAKAGAVVSLMFGEIDFGQIEDGIVREEGTAGFGVSSLVIEHLPKRWWEFWRN